MDSELVQSIVEEVLQQMNKRAPGLGSNEVPIGVSARHVHLSEHDLAVLFGAGYELRQKKELSQPKQFAAEETVMIAGPKGSIERVRILGPVRGNTQIEVSQTDAFKLGLRPPVRQSGNIEGSSPATIIGPKGSVHIKEGLIIAQAHIHMEPQDAERFGVSDGQYVKVRVGTERPVTFERVLIRVSPRYRLEMHIDTDEANAGLISTGQTGIVIVDGSEVQAPVIPVQPTVEKKVASTLFENKLLTQADVQNSSSDVIRVKKLTIITPLATDTARDLGKRIEIIDE